MGRLNLAHGWWPGLATCINISRDCQRSPAGADRFAGAGGAGRARMSLHHDRPLRNRHYDRSPSAVQRVAIPGRQHWQSDAGRHRQDADRRMAGPLVRRSPACASGWSAAVTVANPASRMTKPSSWPQKLPGVPHVLDRDRVRGARRLIDEFGCQLVILDDGFQHRRLGRDLDIVLDRRARARSASATSFRAARSASPWKAGRERRCSC